MSMGSLPCVGGGGGTLGGGEIGEFKLKLVDGDVEEVGDLCLEAMEDEEVSLVDGIFEGVFGALGDESWCLVEALVDVMEHPRHKRCRYIWWIHRQRFVEARCLELEVELFNLRDKIHNDNHNELLNRFSNLEITRAKHIEEVTALTTENVNPKAQILNNVNSVTKDHAKPIVLAPGKYAIDVEPIPHRLRNNREAHFDYLRQLKESVETIREIVEEAKVLRPLDSSIVSAFRYTKHSQELLEYVIGTCPQDYHQRDKKHAHAPLIRKNQVTLKEQCCLKHMMGDRSRLMNFVKKFIGTVRFRNDHFGAIMGYGDYMIGDSVISRVYYVEGLGHNLFSVRQFCDSDMEVAFRKHFCYVLDTDGVELIKGSRGSKLYTISVASCNV
uniref:Integrase, catalytic region, zinc finger, CCHC-type, peptidase aspartic, catalytic n=1 Tax=Tanacetum cinerariifolium TaxID=118510 RepID=A0A6L2L7A4_TANCI|nr:integrase, catalytic region, zinc finger, CCHC-type, peptidase aspartic, catalytic [Tanacetum cinerariifolium]